MNCVQYPDRKKLLWVGMGIFGLCAFLLGAADLSVAHANDMSTLSKGGVIVKDHPPASQKGATKVEAKIIIPRPPEQIWPVVSNPQQLMREERKVKQIKTVARSGNTQEVEYTVMLNKLLPTFNYTLKLESKQPNVVEFHRISGSFKDFEGSWKLTPIEGGNKTLLTYTLSIDPGFFAPKFLVLQAIKSDLPSMMQNVKSSIDKHVSSRSPQE
jgi:carbon monoxide dehydrogenase subunit G